MATIKFLFPIFSHVPCGEAEDKRLEVRPEAKQTHAPLPPLLFANTTKFIDVLESLAFSHILPSKGGTGRLALKC